MKIIPMQAQHLKMASVLFNEYRMFYDKPSDLYCARSPIEVLAA